MLFSILKVDKTIARPPSNTFSVSLSGQLYRIEASKKNDYTEFDIGWNNGTESKNIKGLYFVYKTETIILIASFSKSLKELSTQILGIYLNSKVIQYHFSLNDMQKLLKSFGNIMEMRLRTPDPIIEEINVVGEDLEDSKTFDYLKSSEVVHFTTFNKDFSASMKVFEDGRISIIPERDYEIVVSFLMDVLEKL